MSYPGIRPYRREDTDALQDSVSHNPEIPATLASIWKASLVSKAAGESKHGHLIFRPLSKSVNGNSRSLRSNPPTT